MKIWFKIIKNNRLLQDTTITDESNDTRTHKIFGALEQVCYEFDLSRPIWLDANIKELKQNAKTRFRQESFVEQIEFDFLEMQILEED